MEALQNLTRGSREMLPCVSTTSINCQDVHTHSQCLVLSADSLNRELKLLLPAVARSLWVTAAARLLVQERWSSRRSRCSCKKPPGLGSSSCSCHYSKQPSSLEPEPTGAQTYLTPPKPSTSAIPMSNQAFSSPRSLLYPTKDVVKQNLWSLYSNRASNSAHTAARKEGEREDVPYKRMWLPVPQQPKKMLREVRQQRRTINSAEWEGRRIRTAQLEQARADEQ